MDLSLIQQGSYLLSESRNGGGQQWRPHQGQPLPQGYIEAALMLEYWIGLGPQVISSYSIQDSKSLKFKASPSLTDRLWRWTRKRLQASAQHSILNPFYVVRNGCMVNETINHNDNRIDIENLKTQGAFLNFQIRGDIENQLWRGRDESVWDCWKKDAPIYHPPNSPQTYMLVLTCKALYGCSPEPNI